MKRTLTRLLIGINILFGLTFSLISITGLINQVSYSLGAPRDFFIPAMTLGIGLIILYQTIQWGYKNDRRALAISFLVGAACTVLLGLNFARLLAVTFPAPSPELMVRINENLAGNPSARVSAVNGWRISMGSAAFLCLTTAAGLIWFGIRWNKEEIRNPYHL